MQQTLFLAGLPTGCSDMVLVLVTRIGATRSVVGETLQFTAMLIQTLDGFIQNSFSKHLLQPLPQL